ncbi:valacyclovir hydrolase isoform X2 [Pectinophora gossypiella]|uniref:valacyclovir hydrolase isoform X2 n=1 Tax=Pectinophora gossypiella TaxID=13191 RepID=UPI00214EAA37|nr:valacyclovir hydrolase isoform X2 [Pectinophora gossypiella]
MFKEEKIKVGEWNINYLKVGSGPHTLLCMPGALGSIWTDFKPQVEGIDREKFTVVAWDPPGYGKSRPPLRDFPPELYERDADYAYEFMKALNIPKYSPLGWSDGGISSLILAAKYPAAVNKLVVWGTNTLILPHELEVYKKIRDIDSWSKRMREPMIAVYGEDLFRKYWAEWVDGMVALFNAKNGEICSSMLKNIKCPTFILYGQKDPMVDGSHVAHLHTNIEGSRIHLYPDGKHNIHIAYAEDFNKRIEEFLLK